MLIGCHINNPKSILDALNITVKSGGNILQIFLGDNVLTTLSKKIKLSTDEIKEIKSYMKTNDIKLVVHSILSLNFCKDPFYKRNTWGVDNLIYDLNLCAKLGGIGCVIHLGTYKTKNRKMDISYEECTKNFVNSIKYVLDNTTKGKIIIETSVNKEGGLAGTLEELAELFAKIPPSYKKRVGICIDTAHIFLGGYDIRDGTIIEKYFRDFDSLIGMKYLTLVHINDSEKELGTRVDRHAPLGEGYIFSNKLGGNMDSLKLIVMILKKNNIPMVLETRSHNFSREINLLHKMEELRNGGGQKKVDMRNKIITIFETILNYYKIGGKEIQYKIISYENIIRCLKRDDGPIYTINDVSGRQYIGAKSLEKINTIIITGTYPLYEIIKSDAELMKKIKSYVIFQKIFGIGPESAKKFIESGIYTIDELKRGRVNLTEQQLIGLKYYDKVETKITRSKINKITDSLKDSLKSENINVINAGSYRLGKESSGDVDLIITSPKMTPLIKDKIVGILKKSGILIEILSFGNTKLISFIKVKGKIYQMDVAFIREDEIPWYLLYFGSSRNFSKRIRLHASKLGYKLSEKGLFNKINGTRIDFYPRTEEEIFHFLNMEYVKPENRNV
jgi:apurinic endonuclease APN1